MSDALRGFSPIAAAGLLILSILLQSPELIPCQFVLNAMASFMYIHRASAQVIAIIIVLMSLAG
jgi:hypothetical protein